MKTIALSSILLLLLSCGAPKQESTEAEASTEQVAAESGDDIVDEAPPVSNPANVVDYFRLLQWRGLADDYYHFIERDGEYVCVENMGDTFDYNGPLTGVRVYPATVDIKNGYLRVEDEGTGEGVLYTEVALFKKSNNSYLVALNGYGKDPNTVGFDGARPKFLVWENNDFVDKTDEVMPPTSWTKVDGSHEYYRLPQLGRVVDHVRHFIDSAAQPMEQITKEQLEFDSSLGKFVIKG